MSITLMRVQQHDRSRILEYAMADRSEVLELVLAFERIATVKAFQLFCEGKQIESFHDYYSVHEDLTVTKFTSTEFKW